VVVPVWLFEIQNGLVPLAERPHGFLRLASTWSGRAGYVGYQSVNGVTVLRLGAHDGRKDDE
jgi:hypothetical protein